jgi:D-alanyl-D-alanine carboxypeptidase/D-alanyl-D-alanine-endopeptidase (penicillin-binding protein 4)
MRRLLALICLLAFAGPAAALAAGAHLTRSSAAGRLARKLARDARAAGRFSGEYVFDSTSNRVLFRSRSNTVRILASNTKLFTSAAVLARYGPSATLATTVLGTGSLGSDGTYSGDLYLRGGGDPTFGSRSFARRAYGSNASVEALADELRAAGVRRVTGSVVGDETLFDSRRGGPSSGFGVSIYVGPLSALDYNRGLANADGSAFQQNPPLFAADKLRSALQADGIGVHGSSHTGRVPAGAVELVEVRSPTIGRLLQLMDKTSDNFFAEMLVKGLAVDTEVGGPLRPAGAPLPPAPVPGGPAGAPAPGPPPDSGTTLSGARVAITNARTLGARPRLVDGSGLSTSDRATPHDVATLLARLESRPGFPTFYAALSIAGRDGTLSGRMRSGPAHNRCHGKTGTLTGVSALSGYCNALNHHRLVFSILMNGVGDLALAHALQDAMAQAIAAY